MESKPTTDHGEFRIQTSRNDDMKIVRGSVAKAKINPSKPGHHWQRIVFKQDTPDGQVETIKMFHVDLRRGIVEITETLLGNETARRTMKLADLE